MTEVEDRLSPEEKKRKLYLRQKEMLEGFLARGAISQAQFDKSFGDLTEKMGMGKMRVTFIHHSGFFVEQPDACFLFDYWKGELPEPGNRPLFVFVSHFHGDHFDPRIFEYAKTGAEVSWILADDIKKKKVPQELLSRVIFAAPGREYQVECGGVRVDFQTLRSTDSGNAYLIRHGGKTIYHAGDLHLWLWREDEAADCKMREAYEKETDRLRGLSIDAAFLPLDPRQEIEDRPKGLDHLARKARLGRIYPMHCQQDFSVVEQLINDTCSDPYRDAICPIDRDGYSEEI